MNHWPKFHDPRKLGREPEHQYKLFKFVKTTTGFWRIWRLDDGFRHNEIIKEEEKAVCAGLICPQNGYVRMESSYSTSLRVGTNEDHWNELEELLGVPLKSRLED